MRFWKSSCENTKTFDEIWKNFCIRSNASQKRFSWFFYRIPKVQKCVLFAPSGHMPRVTSIYFLTQCSPCSHCQRSVPCALSFRYSSRPRCFAAVWWFLLRGRVLRPEDACQKRFSWFFNWIPKVQKCVNLVDLVKSFQTSLSMSLFLNLLFERDSYSNEYLLAKFGVDRAENGPLKVCQKLAKS